MTEIFRCVPELRPVFIGIYVGLGLICTFTIILNFQFLFSMNVLKLIFLHTGALIIYWTPTVP